MAEGPFLLAYYLDDSDESYFFDAEGDQCYFGRDDSVCQIRIWSAINGTALSAVAGRIWRMEGELWVRNLSSRHELEVRVSGQPPDPPLRKRRDDGWDPGPARELPAPLCHIVGPAGCLIVVRQTLVPSSDIPESDLTGGTRDHVPPVPSNLMRVAAALCAPLAAGRSRPATRRQISARLNMTPSKVQGGLTQLCVHYMDAVPDMRRRIMARRAQMHREEALEAPLVKAPGGIWVPVTRPSGARVEEARRRRDATLDDLAVAFLLWRNGRVTKEDVANLPGPRPNEDVGSKGSADGGGKLAPSRRGIWAGWRISSESGPRPSAREARPSSGACATSETAAGTP
jgi:hypothetical protein